MPGSFTGSGPGTAGFAHADGSGGPMSLGFGGGTAA